MKQTKQILIPKGMTNTNKMSFPIKNKQIKRLVLLLMLSITFSSCYKDNTVSSNINGTWHMTNMSGGVAGIDIDYANTDILWIFDDLSATLTVNVAATVDNYHYLSPGTYDYSILIKKKLSYLVVDTEIGQISIIDSQMIIDENKQSNADGTDGYILKLEKN